MISTSGPSEAPWTAVRGDLISIDAERYDAGLTGALRCQADGLLLCQGGLIRAVGPYEALRHQIPPGVEVDHYQGCLISPGFIDAHIHYPQIGMIGSAGHGLLDWLDHYVFDAEMAFADPVRAQAAAEVFCDELLRNGTTTALVFCSVHAVSVDALFRAAEARNMRLIAGKTLMDRNAPQGLLDTAQSAYDESQALIDRWHGHGRALYAVTPRFAITSTPAQLEAAGALLKLAAGLSLHSHIAETLDEVAMVRSLYQERQNYLDVYDHYGLVGARTVLAHGVHLSEPELQHCHDTCCALAHCPTSNMFLGSGMFSLATARRDSRPVKVGLGTDVGAGTSFSLLATAGEAYKVAQAVGDVLPVTDQFYLATLGGARALALEEKLGALDVGMEADFVVLDPRATPLLAYRLANSPSLEEILSVLMTLADDRVVRATYTGGMNQSRVSFNSSVKLAVMERTDPFSSRI
jgi:guanine deaminase